MKIMPLAAAAYLLELKIFRVCLRNDIRNHAGNRTGNVYIIDPYRGPGAGRGESSKYFNLAILCVDNEYYLVILSATGNLYILTILGRIKRLR